MEVANLAGLAFRMASVFVGIVLAYFVMLIYFRTKGGSSGWVSLAVSYVSLGLWALFQMFFTTAFPSATAREVMGAFLFMAIAISNPLATAQLSRDMRVKVCRFFSPRNVLLLEAVVLLGLLAYNIMAPPFAGLAKEVVTAALLSIGILFLVSARGYSFIYKGTGLRIWAIMLASSLFVSMGVFLVVAFSDCCGVGGALQGTDSCSSWIYDYADAWPVPCIPGLLPVSSSGALLILLGELLTLYPLMKLVQLMGGMKPDQLKSRKPDSG